MPALRIYLHCLPSCVKPLSCRFHSVYSPQIPRWDTSKLRAKGARLKTFGGRASGPEPLEALFLFAVNMFQHARGRRLTPLEAHDLVCKVAEIVVVGGVRRCVVRWCCWC
jgi:ribonucleoside-diphosphate reductase alpha chain